MSKSEQKRICIQSNCIVREELLEQLNAKADSFLGEILSLVYKQAEDEGLWFDAKTAPEAYLQSKLRELHYVIEEFRVE